MGSFFRIGEQKLIRKQPINLPFHPLVTPSSEGVEEQSLFSKTDRSYHLETRRVIIQPGSLIPDHSCSYDQHIFVIQGKGAFFNTKNEKTTGVNSNIFFIPQNDIFRVENEGKTPLVILITTAISQT